MTPGDAPGFPVVLRSAGSFVLTGPSFAADIARGLPTALTLAGPDDGSLQDAADARYGDDVVLVQSALHLVTGA